MRRSVAALPLILIGAFVATTSIALPAAPVPAEPHPGTAAATPAPGELRVTPVGAPSAVVSVDPGASVQRSFVVANGSAGLRFTVHLAAVDATPKPGGGIRYGTSASIAGPASWLTLSDVVATLEPGARIRVSLTIAPPANADPGKDLAGLVVRVDRAVRVADGAPVTKHLSAALPVAMNLNGAPTALVSIVSVQAVKASGHDFLEITFQNGGKIANTMVGRARVLGKHPTAEPVHAQIAPLRHTIVRVPFAMPPGAKTVPVSVDASDAGGDQATWSGSVGSGAPKVAPAPSASPRSGSGSAAAVHHATSAPASTGPTRPTLAQVIVGLAVLVAVGWLGAELRRARKRRRVIRLAPLDGGVAAATAAVMGVATTVERREVGEDQLGAFASQLGALVDAIDRLVGSIGTWRPGEVAPPAAPTPSAPPIVRAAARAPAAASEAVPAAEPSEALFYAAAAPSPGEPDPYDWPTQAQLDQFAARRRAAEADPA
jgi:hypothetical protein